MLVKKVFAYELKEGDQVISHNAYTNDTMILFRVIKRLNDWEYIEEENAMMPTGYVAIVTDKSKGRTVLINDDYDFLVWRAGGTEIPYFE